MKILKKNNLLQEIKRNFIKFNQEKKNINTLKKLVLLKIKYIGKKNKLSNYLKKLKIFSVKDKKKFFILINYIKKIIKKELIILQKKISLDVYNIQQEKYIDVSLPGRVTNSGSIHPITNTIYIIESFFTKLGFQITSGPEIENKYYNFDSLNIPFDHPSRNEQDTFWFDKNNLLRTQTSSVQIRFMEQNKPPIKIIAPGKVYRNDFDSTHTPMFHQVEGLVIDKNISFSNLKWLMYSFIEYFFDFNVSIRFRNSYFPFTLPSAEIDIKQNNKWIEILGCGLVHVNVLKTVNINPKKYSGLAFGIGVERITMLKYGIKDLRSFFDNDLNLIKQFK